MAVTAVMFGVLLCAGTLWNKNSLGMASPHITFPGLHEPPAASPPITPRERHASTHPFLTSPCAGTISRSPCVHARDWGTLRKHGPGFAETTAPSESGLLRCMPRGCHPVCTGCRHPPRRARAASATGEAMGCSDRVGVSIALSLFTVKTVNAAGPRSATCGPLAERRKQAQRGAPSELAPAPRGGGAAAGGVASWRAGPAPSGIWPLRKPAAGREVTGGSTRSQLQRLGPWALLTLRPDTPAPGTAGEEVTQAAFAGPPPPASSSCGNALRLPRAGLEELGHARVTLEPQAGRGGRTAGRDRVPREAPT